MVVCSQYVTANDKSTVYLLYSGRLNHFFYEMSKYYLIKKIKLIITEMIVLIQVGGQAACTRNRC